MAVAQISTASLDKLFLEYIKPGLEKQFITNTILYGRFNTRPEICLGKYGVMKVMTGGAQSAGPASTTAFPTAKQGSYNEFKFYLKRGMYGTLQFDGLAIAVGKGAGAVKELVKQEIEGIELVISNRLNRQFWGDGSGRLAQLSAGVANAATAYIDGPWFGQDSNDYTAPSTYLDEGMSVDIYSTAGVLEAEDITISTITTAGTGTDTLTLGSSVTASNNSYLLHHNSYAVSDAAGTGVPMGIYGLASTANATIGITATALFQGVDRSTNTWAQAQVFNMGTSSAAPGVLTNKKMLEVVQKLEKYGKIDAAITNGVIWRQYYAILEADKTLPNTPAFWGGTSGLSFYGGRGKSIAIIWDDDCPDQSMYFLDSSKIAVAAPTKSGMEWLPGDSGHVLTRVQGKDEFVANLKWYYNMTTNMPKALGLLRYIKHAEV